MILNRREALQAIAVSAGIGARHSEVLAKAVSGEDRQEASRLKLAHLSPRVMLAMLNHQHGEFVSLPVSPMIPEGVVVEGVWFEQRMNLFCARLWHPSYEPVPDGQIPPSIDGVIETTALRRIPVDSLYEQAWYVSDAGQEPE